MLLNVSRFMWGDSFISVVHRMSIFILLCSLFFLFHVLCFIYRYVHFKIAEISTKYVHYILV